MRNYSIKNLIWTNKGNELDHLAQIILNDENHYYICGENNELIEFAQRIGNYLKPNIDGYFGTKTEKYEDFEIIEKKELFPVKEKALIVCLNKNRKKYEEMRCICNDQGLKENEQFFQGEVFTMIYEVYKLGKICIDRIEVFLTSLCTLNCEKCISYIPYFKKPVIVPLQQLKDDADLLFQTVDYVYKLKLLGGEGFLYPYIIEYIDYLHEHYGNRIGSVRIGTNGTVFPSRAVLEMCKRNHVTIDISDYTKAVPNMCMLNEVKTVCEDNGVAVDVKRTGEQWLDMGFPNDLPEEKTEDELKEHFQKCAMFCRQFSSGKYYFCCSNFAAVLAGLFPDDGNNYIDFRQGVSRKELLEFELGYSNMGHTTFCNVCRGGSEEANAQHVEVAKQIRKGL